MTRVYSHGPYGTISHEPIVEQAVTFVAGSPTAKPSPNDAYLSFQKAMSHGIASWGTFVATGASAVTVADVNMLKTSIVDISLNTVGGTVGAAPTLTTITAGTGFTVTCTALDTSTYNYSITNLLA